MISGRSGAAESIVTTSPRASGLTVYASDQLSQLQRLRQEPAAWTHGWTPDLTVLTLLLALTAAGGRAFAKLALDGDSLYPTEWLLALVIILAVRRTGVRGAATRVRTLLPLPILFVLWFAGAVATVRGLAWGFGNLAHDIGLVEYSVLVPIAALLVDDRERARRAVSGVFFAGLVAVPAYQIAWDTSPIASFGHWQNPSVAVSIYLGVSILLVVSRLALGVPPSAVAIIFAVWSVWLMHDTGARSSLAAFAVAIVVVIALAPHHRLVAGAILVTAFAVYVFGAWAWQGFPAQTPPAPPPSSPPNVARYWVADDVLSDVVGGGPVTGDGAAGTTASRQAAIHQPLTIPAITGLLPGQPYVVRFWVKTSARTIGYAGNNVGTGWNQARWSVPGSAQWQAVRVVLVARARQDEFALSYVRGPALLLFDGLTIRRRGISGLPKPRPAPSAPKTTWREHLPPVLHDIVEGFNSNDTSGANANSSWRQAIWTYMIRRTIHGDPIFGIGFGRPTNFLYHGILFDGRRGNPSNPDDEIPPHNSFVNLLFRTGFLGFLALLALVFVAARRVLAARKRALPPRDAADLVGMAAVFAFSASIAFLNAALEGPYMALFFWFPLGLLLVMPKLNELDADQPQAAR